MRYVAICLTALVIGIGFAFWRSDEVTWKYMDSSLVVAGVDFVPLRIEQSSSGSIAHIIRNPAPILLPGISSHPSVTAAIPTAPNGTVTQPPGPTQSTDPPTPNPPPPDPSAEYRQKIRAAISQQAEKSRVVIRIAKTLVVGNPEKMELFIQQGTGEEASTLAGGATAAVDMTTQIASAVTAHADSRSSNLDVVAVSGIPATQIVSFSAPTRWAWKLDPKEVGSAEVLITLTHRISIDGKDHDIPVRYFPYTINIEVHSWNIIRDWISNSTNAINLVVGFFAAAAGLIAIFRPGKAGTENKN